MAITAGPLARIKAIRLDSWLGGLLSLVVGVGLYVSTEQAIENDAQNRFTYMARTVQSTLDGRIKSYADLLRGTSSLFMTTGEVTRDAFRRYVAGLDLSQPVSRYRDDQFCRPCRRCRARRIRSPDAAQCRRTAQLFDPPGRPPPRLHGADLHRTGHDLGGPHRRRPAGASRNRTGAGAGARQRRSVDLGNPGTDHLHHHRTRHAHAGLPHRHAAATTWPGAAPPISVRSASAFPSSAWPRGCSTICRRGRRGSSSPA